MFSAVVSPGEYRHGVVAEPNGTRTWWRIYCGTLDLTAEIERDGFFAAMDALRNTAAGLKGRALPGPHDYEQIPDLAERGRKRLEHFFRDMDVRLAGGAFVAGDRYTIADISAMIVVDFAGRLKLALPDDCANLKRWYAAVSARPSAKA